MDLSRRQFAFSMLFSFLSSESQSREGEIGHPFSLSLYDFCRDLISLDDSFLSDRKVFVFITRGCSHSRKIYNHVRMMSVPYSVGWIPFCLGNDISTLPECVDLFRSKNIQKIESFLNMEDYAFSDVHDDFYRVVAKQNVLINQNFGRIVWSEMSKPLVSPMIVYKKSDRCYLVRGSVDFDVFENLGSSSSMIDDR